MYCWKYFFYSNALLKMSIADNFGNIEHYSQLKNLSD